MQNLRKTQTQTTTGFTPLQEKKMFGKKTEKEPSGEFFTVYDSKAKTYAEPFPCPNAAVLMRDFTTAFRNPEAATKNRYYQNAEDFSIFRCGSFDLQTGLITSSNLEHVANMHDLKAMVEPGH